MKKSILAIIAIVVVVIIVVLAPKGSTSLFSTAGGGLSLKDLNKQDTVTTSVGIILQVNQTTRQNLEQGLVIANYMNRKNGVFFGAGMLGGVSTEYGVCCPTMYLNMGLDFTSFQLEYRVGNFKRTGITTDGVDPQYSNFCTDLGEGASAKNAMQLSFIKRGALIGLGHQGTNSFYDFDNGFWYAFAEAPVCRNLSLAGGMNFAEITCGYVAAKMSVNDNKVTITGNQLGTEQQNVAVTYNRENIPLKRNKLTLSVSAWAKEAEQGFHFVAGLIKGNGMFFAQIGSNLCENHVTPYCGIGTSFNF